MNKKLLILWSCNHLLSNNQINKYIKFYLHFIFSVNCSYSWILFLLLLLWEIADVVILHFLLYCLSSLLSQSSASQQDDKIRRIKLYYIHLLLDFWSLLTSHYLITYYSIFIHLLFILIIYCSVIYYFIFIYLSFIIYFWLFISTSNFQFLIIKSLTS